MSFDTAAELVADLTGDTEKLDKAVRACGPAAARRSTTPSISRAATS